MTTAVGVFVFLAKFDKKDISAFFNRRKAKKRADSKKNNAPTENRENAGLAKAERT